MSTEKIQDLVERSLAYCVRIEQIVIPKGKSTRVKHSSKIGGLFFADEVAFMTSDWITANSRQVFYRLMCAHPNLIEFCHEEFRQFISHRRTSSDFFMVETSQTNVIVCQIYYCSYVVANVTRIFVRIDSSSLIFEISEPIRKETKYLLDVLIVP